MDEYVKELAEELKCSEEDISTRLQVNNDVWKDFNFADEMPSDYPWGWCDKKRWEAFCDKHPDEYWFRWEEMLYENLDIYLENDAIKLKER